MSPAIHLNQTETKKIEDKSSLAYKALLTMLREFKDRTGFKFSVIGTDSKGKLFELDINESK